MYSNCFLILLYHQNTSILVLYSIQYCISTFGIIKRFVHSLGYAYTVSRVEFFCISYSTTLYSCRNETSRKKVEEEKARMIATQPQYKSGMLLRVSNLPKNAGFREMREFFARVCDVAWIDMADDQVEFASGRRSRIARTHYITL